MNDYQPNLPPAHQPLGDPREPLPLTLADVFPEYVIDYPPPPPRPRRVWLPIFLFFATCITTCAVGTLNSDFAPPTIFNADWRPAVMEGLIYSAAVMTILLCHEMGHFLQAVRYGVRASLPYFLPVPMPPIGTFGAVIAMEPRQGDRKAIFDIGISGPLAGLVPTLLFLCIGIALSPIAPTPLAPQMRIGVPPLMHFLIEHIKGPMPGGLSINPHPLAFAGWVGLFITSLNLVPIGQLDGGHILYGMFRKKAHAVSMVVLMLAIGGAIYMHLQSYFLMLGLIAYLGTRHPPTADDSVPLGVGRYVLGALTLAFLIVGFTPVPLSFGP